MGQRRGKRIFRLFANSRGFAHDHLCPFCQIACDDLDMVRVGQAYFDLDWAYESMQYRKQVYAIGDGNLGYKYTYQHFGIVRERLLQAGIRLAGVLNEIYGK